MRKNILNNTFITFILMASMLTACDQNSNLTTKGGPKPPVAVGDAPSQINTNIEDLLAQGNALIQENLPLAQTEIKAEKQETTKDTIDALNKKYKDYITQKSDKKEEASQYGMQTGVFDKLTNTKNKKKYSDDENKSLRNNFYGSLNWDKTTIEDFGKIIAQIETSVFFKGTWPKDLIDAGQIIQEEFDKAINQINSKKDKLDSLSDEKLKELKETIDQIELSKNTWSKFVTDIIKDHKDNKDSIKDNKEKLVYHIKKKYDPGIKPELQKVKDANASIKKILDEI